MPPYLRVAHHISLYAKAHRCSWLPKCSGRNATRHRATRRDTRISPSRDQHDSRGIALRGKHHASAHANDNPKRGIGVRPAQYPLPGVPAGRRWGGGTGGDRGYWPTMARYLDASFAAATDCDLSRNRATTRDRDACAYLDRRQGQYLTAYLMQGLRVYRCHRLVHNLVVSRGHARRADRLQGCAAYHAILKQTDTYRHWGAACTPVCNTIVTGVVGRVAYTTAPRVGPLIRVQVPDAVERQMIAWIEPPATSSVILIAGQRVCTTAGPQTPRHTYPQAAAPVVGQVRKWVAA